MYPKLKTLAKKVLMPATSAIASIKFLSLIALAAAPATKITAPINTPTKILAAVTAIANFMSALFFGLATIFVIYAAIVYLTAAGNQSKLDQAKSTLVYAIVAIIIALIAFALPTLIKAFIT